MAADRIHVLVLFNGVLLQLCALGPAERRDARSYRRRPQLKVTHSPQEDTEPRYSTVLLQGRGSVSVCVFHFPVLFVSHSARLQL